MWIAIGVLGVLVLMEWYWIGKWVVEIQRLTEIVNQLTENEGKTIEAITSHLVNQHGMKVEEFWVSMN